MAPLAAAGAAATCRASATFAATSFGIIGATAAFAAGFTGALVFTEAAGFDTDAGMARCAVAAAGFGAMSRIAAAGTATWAMLAPWPTSELTLPSTDDFTIGVEAPTFDAATFGAMFLAGRGLAATPFGATRAAAAFAITGLTPRSISEPPFAGMAWAFVALDACLVTFFTEDAFTLDAAVGFDIFAAIEADPAVFNLAFDSGDLLALSLAIFDFADAFFFCGMCIIPLVRTLRFTHF